MPAFKAEVFYGLLRPKVALSVPLKLDLLLHPIIYQNFFPYLIFIFSYHLESFFKKELGGQFY